MYVMDIKLRVLINYMIFRPKKLENYQNENIFTYILHDNAVSVPMTC